MWMTGIGMMCTNGYFRREEFPLQHSKKITAFKKMCNDTDIYYTCYDYQLINNKRLLYGSFYLDFDGDFNNEFDMIKAQVLEALEILKKEFILRDEHINLFFSGSKGFHIIISAYNMGAQACFNLNDLYKSVAIALQKQCSCIDTKIYDNRRVLRFPNSINRKTGLYKIPLNTRHFSLMTKSEILALASAPVSLQDIYFVTPYECEANRKKLQLYFSQYTQALDLLYKAQKKAFDKTLLSKNCVFPCIDRMLNDIHYEGQRNEKLVIIASHFYQKGVEYEEVFQFILEWNETHNIPPLAATEIEITAKSAKKQFDMGRTYGCRSILNTGYCNLDCNFNSERTNYGKKN